MNFKKIPLKETHSISKLVDAYISGSENIRQLYEYAVNEDSFETVANNVKATCNFRVELSEVIENQYSGIEKNPEVVKSIQLLTQENTFTITTAHQLCLLTGPLYFIYKITSVIKLSKELSEKYPHYNFVPVYWMGSEDHDFEEVNHLNVFGKKVVWNTNQSGPVGRFGNSGMNQVFSELKEIFSNDDYAVEVLNQWHTFFPENANYGASFQAFINHLFGQYGLVVINQDDKNLKKLFSDEIEKELNEGFVFSSIQPTLNFLDNHYHVQAVPREINLFYLGENFRERIIDENGSYKVNNTKIEFSKDALMAELHSNPENFSPNVMMRPLYQQKVLPNLATIGGGGEVAYWLQLKEVFKKAGIEYPILLLRDMATIISPQWQQKISQWNISYSDLFLSKDELVKKIIFDASEVELSLFDEKAELEKLFEKVMQKALAVDKNLEKSVEAEKQKNINSLENIEAKLVRAEKKNQEQQVAQIERMKDKLFPSGTLQERYDNFMPYYFKYGNSFFELLIEHFHIPSKEMHIIEE